MPYKRSYTRKTTYSRRGRYGGRKARMYRRVARVVRNIVPKPEIKYADFVFTSAIDSNEVWTTLNEIKQGTNYNERVGNKIRPLWVDIKGRVRLPDNVDEDPTVDITLNHATLAMVGLIRDNNDTQGTAPSYSTIYRAEDVKTAQVATGPQAPYNIANAGRFQTLIKRAYYTLNIGGDTYMDFRMFKKFHPKTKQIIYDGPNAADWGKNPIYLVLGTDQDSSSDYKPIFDFVARLAFYDN